MTFCDTLDYRRFFLLLVAKAQKQLSARPNATISKLKGGVLWLICPLKDAGIYP